MTSARVSVVIPVYNGERYLAEALESVFAQTLPPHEVIVVDDGSTDGSAAIAGRYPVTLIRRENRGPAAARNTGVAVCTGEYLAFLDADDTWMPEKLERQVALLAAAGTEAAIALSHMRLNKEEGDIRKLEFVLGEQAREDVLPAYLPSAWVMPLSLFRSVGPFNESYRVSEDTDWYLRARTSGAQALVCEEPLITRRFHDNNISWDYREIRKNLMTVLRANVRERQK